MEDLEEEGEEGGKKFFLSGPVSAFPSWDLGVQPWEEIPCLTGGRKQRWVI